MTDVMISYSRRDADFVRRLHSALESRGRKVWVDWQDIPLSADWWQEIANAIEAADTFVFVISPDSAGSPVCNLEIDHARHNNKRLVPILYRDTSVEDALDLLEERELSDNMNQILDGRPLEEVARENWNAVARHNWLYFQDHMSFDDNIDRLISVIETDLEHLKNHTRLLVRASEWDQRKRHPSYLLNGAEIIEAENWLARGMGKDPAPTSLHADYISASRRAANGRQRRLLVSVSIALVIAVALTILSLFLAFYADNQRTIAVENAATATVAQGQAIEQAEIAATNAAIASRNAAEANSLFWANNAGQLLSTGDTSLALSLALAASNIDEPPPLSRRILADAAYAPGPRERIEFDGVDVNVVAFSPDGQIAAIGLADQRVILYDLEQGSIRNTFDQSTVSITTLDYSNDGQSILTASFNRVILFDANTMELKQSMQHGSGTFVNTVAISPDGTRALSGALDNTVILWDLTTGEAIYTLREHTNAVNSVAFSPDGTRALSGSADDTMILWDLSNGKAITRFDERSDVTTVAFSPSGETAVSGTQLGNLTYWTLETGSLVRRFGNSGNIRHTQAVLSLDFDPQGSRVISAGEDRQVILWDIHTGEAVLAFNSHTDVVTSVAFSPDGQTVLSGSADDSVYWWSITSSAVSESFNGVHDGEITSATYSNDGTWILSSDVNGNLILWDAMTGALLQQFDNAQVVNTVTFIADDTQFISGDADGVLLLWDVESGVVQQRFEGHEASVLAIVISPDGAQMLSGDADGVMILWDLESGEVVQRIAENGHRRDILSLAFNADGTRALSGSADRNMILWDIANAEPLASYRHEGRVLAVAFGPNKDLLYAGSNSDEIVAWDSATGEINSVIRVGIEGAERTVSSIAFNAVGDAALVGRTDGALLLVDLQLGGIVATVGNESSEDTGRNQINSIVFRPDGHEAVVGTRTPLLFIIRTLHINELIEWTRTNRYIRELTCDEREQYNLDPLCTDEGVVPSPTPSSG